MNYELTVAERNLRAGFDPIAKDRALLFCAVDDDMRRHERRLGVFKSRRRVPRNLLMPGDYVAGPSFGIDSDRWIVHNDVTVSVRFMQIDGLSMTYMDTYRKPGYLVAELAWGVTNG